MLRNESRYNGKSCTTLFIKKSISQELEGRAELAQIRLRGGFIFSCWLITILPLPGRLTCRIFILIIQTQLSWCMYYDIKTKHHEHVYNPNKKPRSVSWVSLSKSAFINAITTAFQRTSICISSLWKHTNSCNIRPCAHIFATSFSSSSVHCPLIYRVHCMHCPYTLKSITTAL